MTRLHPFFEMMATKPKGVAPPVPCEELDEETGVCNGCEGAFPVANLTQHPSGAPDGSTDPYCVECEHADDDEADETTQTLANALALATPKGFSAKDLVRLTGFEKHLINQTLYGNREVFCLLNPALSSAGNAIPMWGLN